MAHPVLTALQFHNEEAAFEHVEKLLWLNGPVCPHCGATEEHVGRLTGKTSRTGLRKCYACRETFTVRVGTIFEDSHLALHLWLQVIHLMCSSKKGIATRQIQRMLNCSMKTAWHLTHRIRAAMADGGLGPLGGEGKTVEADETFIGGKEKNKHRSKRVGRKMGNTGKEPCSRSWNVMAASGPCTSPASRRKSFAPSSWRMLTQGPSSTRMTRANIAT